MSFEGTKIYKITIYSDGRKKLRNFGLLFFGNYGAKAPTLLSETEGLREARKPKASSHLGKPVFGLALELGASSLHVFTFPEKYFYPICYDVKHPKDMSAETFRRSAAGSSSPVAEPALTLVSALSSEPSAQRKIYPDCYDA